MKYTIIAILLILVSCTNNAPSTSIEQDSTTASRVQFLTSAPATTVYILQNKDTLLTPCAVTIVPYVNPSTPPPPPANNKPPTAKAGADQSVTGSTVTLNGSGSSDPDGTISKYEWTKETGGTVTLNSVNAVANVSGLINGGYRFRLTVTDNSGATATDTVHVSVNGSGGNNPPPPPPPPPPGPTGNYGTVVYSTGYDSKADLDPFGNNQMGNGSISTTVFKTGPGSFHSVPANVSSGIRSEVQYGSAQTPTEGAIEWDVMYVKIQSDNIHSLQFHPNTSGGSASPGLWHTGGKFTWVNWKGGTNTQYPTGVTIQANHWYHMIFQYKMGSSGYMKFTIDGTVVLNKTGIQVGDGSGAYLKVGTNSWSGTNSEAYYDNLKIWRK